MQVAGVARQEHAAVAIAVGDQAARRPLIRTQDLEVALDADGARDQRRGLEVGELLLGLDLRRHVEPVVAAIHRADNARLLAVHQPVHDRGAELVRLVQPRRAEDDVVVAREAAHAFHLAADRVAHAAARTVGADEVAALDDAHLAGGEVAHRGAHALRVLLELQQLVLEPHLDAGQRDGVLAHHFLDDVLRNPLRVFGVERMLERPAAERVLELVERPTGQAGGEHDVRRVVDAERRRLPQFSGDAPAAHVLARAQVGGLGARRVADAVVLLDHEALHAAMAEFDGEAEADGPGADDEDFGVFAHCGCNPTSLTTLRHSARCCA